MSHYKSSTLGDVVWYCGFFVFYHLRHPLLWPLTLLRRATKRLSSEEYASYNNLEPKPLPKKLWIFWAQGWESAPALVQTCRDSWVKYNPDWDIVFLSDKNLADYVDLGYSLEGREITTTGYSNLVRLHLLSKYGGVWADATCFCSAPLDHWLPQLMQSGFFAFNKPKTTVASWFLAAQQNEPLVQRWAECARKYWRFTRKPQMYFWVQYMFEYMVARDHVARRVWAQTPHINTDGSYAVQRRLKEKGADIDVCVEMIFSPASPIHKLSNKTGIPEEFVERLKG